MRNQPPVVALDNYEAVYDYYANHQQSRLCALAAYAHLAYKYAPDVHYDDTTKEQVRQIRDSNGSFLISVNHPTNHSDQFVLAGTAWFSPLRYSIGHMRVLGKDDLFVDEKQRKRVDMMGSIPVFRSKDHGLRAVSNAGQRMMDISAQRLATGDDLAIFVQGEHEPEHPDRIDTISSGVGHIACRAVKLGAPLHLLSIGIAYDTPGENPNVKNAAVYINPPIAAEYISSKPNEVKRMVHADLQSAVTTARELY